MYDYYEAVKEDVLAYIEDEIDLEAIDYDFNSLENELCNTLYNEDSVTGGESGFYTYSDWEALEYVEDNKPLLWEMCDEFGNKQEIMELWFKDDWQSIDVCLRCYVLGEAISQAVNELEKQHEDEIWKAGL